MSADRGAVLQDALDALGRTIPAVPLDVGAWVQEPSAVGAGLMAGFVTSAPYPNADGEPCVTLVEYVKRSPGGWHVVAHELVAVSLLDKQRRCSRGEVDALLDAMTHALADLRADISQAESEATRELRTRLWWKWLGWIDALQRWTEEVA